MRRFAVLDDCDNDEELFQTFDEAKEFADQCMNDRGDDEAVIGVFELREVLTVKQVREWTKPEQVS